MAREDTYLKVRGHLAELTDEQLEARFWELAQRVVDPMVELARTHTSPSIERSVLMRMGVDSLTCRPSSQSARSAACSGMAGHVVWYCAETWECRAGGRAPAGGRRRLGRRGAEVGRGAMSEHPARTRRAGAKKHRSARS